MRIAAIAGQPPKSKKKPTIRHYVFDAFASAWEGPVIRLHELTEEERMTIGAPPRAAVRRRSVHETWLCRGPHCRRFTMNGSYLTGRCNFCDEPRPQ